MPNVKGPLFSMEASGTLGKTITFDRRGFVRQRVVPANPQTAAQGNQRVKLLNVQKGLTHLGAGAIAAIKVVAPTSYRWNSFLLAQALGSGGTAYDASVTAFDALDSGAQADWDGRATNLGFSGQEIPYQTDAELSAGAVLFIIARALYFAGVHPNLPQPNANNASDWLTFIIS
jgi:hypothetical protein